MRPWLERGPPCGGCTIVSDRKDDQTPADIPGGLK
jgi:hypothetical protein